MQKRGFAAAAGAADGDVFSRVDLHVNAAQSFNAPFVVALYQAARFKIGLLITQAPPPAKAARRARRELRRKAGSDGDVSDSKRCNDETEAETTLAVCGNVESRRNAPHPNADAKEAAGKSQCGRLRKDEQNDVPALPAECTQDADLAGAFKDRHGHGVGDAQNADRGSAIADVPQATAWARIDQLIVGGALGRGNGLKAGKRGFDAAGACLTYASWFHRRARGAA